MKHKIATATVFLATVLASANWVEYAIYYKMSHPILQRIALVGTATLLIAAVCAIKVHRFSLIVGAVGLFLCWLYFLTLLPRLFSRLASWNEFSWFLSFYYLGRDQVLAATLLLVATIFCIGEIYCRVTNTNRRLA